MYRYVFEYEKDGYYRIPQFWIDLAGCIPWQYTDCLPQGNGWALLRILRLFKLARLYRLFRLLQQLRVAYPDAQTIITVLELVTAIVTLAHWMCCVFYFAGSNHQYGWPVIKSLAAWDDEAEDCASLIQRMNLPYESCGASGGKWTPHASPIHELNGVDYEEVSGGMCSSLYNCIAYEYVTAFYWAITTMTTIGYGDISALTLLEKVIASIVMMLGCGVFAWSTGTITSMLTDLPYSVTRFNDTMDELNEFMSARGISKKLTEKLKSFYMLKFPTMRIYDEKSVLDGLPKGLARMTKMELFADVLQICPFFYGMDISHTNSYAVGGSDEHFLQSSVNSTAADICAKFGLLYKTLGLQLTTAGELPDAMYIVRSGMLSVTHHGKQTMIARSGDVVGEMALLGLSADGRRLRTAKCLTMCELVYILKEDLEELMGVEGFRVPLRRMLSQYIDGLASHIMTAQKLGDGDGELNLELKTDSARTQDINDKSWWDDFAFNNIPWVKIQTRLSIADENMKPRDTKKSLDHGQHRRSNDLSQSSRHTDACTAGTRRGVSKALFTTSQTLLIDNKWHKLLRTRLTLTIKSFSLADVVFEGRKRMVIGVSWTSFQTSGANEFKFHFSRAFSRGMLIRCKEGKGEISSSSGPESAVVSLELVHSMNTDWKRCRDMKVFLFEVVGHYSPPLPEDVFNRMEEEDIAGDMDSMRTEDHMRAQEALFGLRLLQVGSIPVHQLILNRGHPLVRPSKSLSSERTMGVMPHDFANLMNRSKICSCPLLPKTDNYDVPGALVFTQVDLSTEAYRILPTDSRWFKCVAALSTTMAQKDNQYFQQLNITRVQKMRRSVFQLFRKADESESGNWAATAFLSDQKILGMRMDQFENQIKGLSHSFDVKFFALSSHLNEIKKMLADKNEG
jgi:CRP-like cAMP-binding protein